MCCVLGGRGKGRWKGFTYQCYNTYEREGEGFGLKLGEGALSHIN